MFLLRISVLILIAFIQCESGEVSQFRIINGRVASPYEFPFHAELVRFDIHNCGGAIVHKFFIVTAAHCVKIFEDLSPIPLDVLHVRVGNEVAATGGIVHQIRAIYVHPNYIHGAPVDTGDIALVKVVKPFIFSDTVKAVKYSHVTPSVGQLGWVVGFGQQKAMRQEKKRHLMAVDLPVINPYQCRGILGKVAYDMICAGYPAGKKDACVGDSGGPFVSGNTLIGIVAWGVGCGRPGLPGVYTNVALYSRWISKVIESY